MSNYVNQLAIRASREESGREELIREQRDTILRTASGVCHRYVTVSDDEWSIALCAFSKAIDVYAEGKGDFLPFAQMLIKRDLIDYFRSQKRTLNESPTAPYILEGNGAPGEDTEGVSRKISQTSAQAAETGIKEEITAANEMLMKYGFRFFDLTDCSPQQEKTKQECAKAVRYVLAQAELRKELEKTRKLPIRAVAAGSGVSKKILDRYRKYIIMAILILDGEYPRLSEYLKFVRKEGTI